MKPFLFSLCFLGLMFSTKAQDFLSPLGSNPSLFPEATSVHKLRKINVQEDSLIFQFDTLVLPFIDDFSKNHLPGLVKDLSASNISDTTFYLLMSGGNPIDKDIELSSDTTYYTQIGVNGDTIQHFPNPFTSVDVNRLDIYPPISSNQLLFPPYNIFDTLGISPDTILTSPDVFQDSMIYYLVDRNPNDWYTSRQALVNNTFGIDPRSIGVATLDGLDQYGIPYLADVNLRVKADELSSVPIDLSGVGDPSSVYFSFYFQPKGLSLNAPEAEDSLVLEFYRPDLNRWGSIWSTPGFASDTFQLVHLFVNPSFHQSAFRFRFRNYAQGSGAYDHWNIDYIVLDENRTTDDTLLQDLAMVQEPPSMISPYAAMPWWHYKSNPSAYHISSTTNIVRNNFEQAQNAFYRMRFLDSAQNNSLYVFPTANLFLPVGADDILNTNYSTNYFYPADSVNGPVILEAPYTVNTNDDNNPLMDAIPSNDTVVSKAILKNYYAYDDGSAEAGYGINPQLTSEGYVAYMTQKFVAPISDTIGGMQIYFLPTFPDIRSQRFEITVWNNNLNPSSIVFSKPVKDEPIYTDPNGFVTYWFDSAIVVGQTFFIGMKAIGEYSMSIGYDLNTNHRNEIFWSFNGVNWNNPSSGIFNGSLMMRPVFRQRKFEVGLTEHQKENSVFDVFPNPVSSVLHFDWKGNLKADWIQVFNSNGQLILEQAGVDQLNVVHLPKGLYFLNMDFSVGIRESKKFMKL